MTEQNILMHNFTDKVVVICPTYNRRLFLPTLIYQFQYQIYPSDLLYMIIFDDSDTSNADIFNQLDLELKKRILYIHSSKRKHIGEKRNILNNIALKLNPKYIICFDDDDYYPPQRIAYSVNALRNSNYLIGGTSVFPIYFIGSNEIYLSPEIINKMRPFHATNSTFIYDVAYLKNNKYDDNNVRGEERKFLRGYRNQLLQLPHNNIILCISHTLNTVDKTKLIATCKKTNIKIEDIINDDMLLHFYTTLNK